MPEAQREAIFDVSADKYFAAITDFEHYPELLPEVSSIEILKNGKTTRLIKYHIQLIKDISYTLKMTLKEPNLVKWQLESGDLFKVNEGSWEIEAIDEDQCRVVYNLNVGLKVFAPKTITKKLVASNLPRMMNRFYEHAQTL